MFLIAIIWKPWDSRRCRLSFAWEEDSRFEAAFSLFRNFTVKSWRLTPEPQKSAERKATILEWKDRHVPYLIMVLATLSRFIPHLWNFSPVYGALLFGGANMKKRESIWFSGLTLGISD